MRKCSHCGHNGHNSRTCPQRGVKLFGVWMVAGSSHGGADIIKKNSSTGNISSSNSTISFVQSNSGSRPAGYVSDSLLHSSCNRKGVCWSEEEHRIFLMGLRAVGKGDWRAISRNFVRSRTPTQVASHAQKYFLRQTSLNKENRRSSMFDISPETALESREGFNLKKMIQKARFSGVPSSSPDPLRWDYSAAPPAEVIRATTRIFPVLEAEKGGLELGTVLPSAGTNLAVNSGLSGFHMTSCDGRFKRITTQWSHGGGFAQLCCSEISE